MMDSCLNNKAEGDSSADFSSSLDSQHSSSEEREHLQVYLRIRPFTSAENSSGESQDCVSIEPPDTVLLKPPGLSLSSRLSVDRSLPQTGQRFQFSQVFGPETTQRELFQGTVKDLVKDVLEGGNSLVFTYGVTNAGKTFTFLGPDADAGILPRSLDVIFSSLDNRVFSSTSIKPHRCRDFLRLSVDQQAEEAAFKRNLFRQIKESERSNISILNSTNKTLLEDATLLTSENRISLDVETHTKFSVWVSFCEIYNENIHDLLEVAPSGGLRRTVLRLSQDVKGNSFVKDLRWVQVNSADEAFKVMKLGKKNQSFSSTRLNQLSSRSHSIFSIRILRIEDVGTPRVHTVSELCLCDLAGSERCAKTQNKGERLKEAGNINTSLLILGKCINALRHNQQAKLLQHVPFRESKLTHYLQSFFCGRGKACMIVNVNQCASMYDETLNVLKFSAVAQKVVILSSRPVPATAQRSVAEVSFSSGERRTRRRSSRSSLNGWESSLEDVQENEDDEQEEENSMMDDTVDANEDDGDKILISKKMHEKQVALLKQLQLQLKRERAENVMMEARVREETSREFTELFSEMQNDFNERLSREREILEERAETRLKIFKNLIDKMSKAGKSQETQATDPSVDSISSELADIKKAAEAAHRCLSSSEAVEELGKKVLELNERQRKVADKHNGESSRMEEDEGKTKLLFQLQGKSLEIVQLEKQVEELQRLMMALGEEKHQLQEALEREKNAREDVLVALELQTVSKEEALTSLQEERKAREEAEAALEELRRRREKEKLASQEEERKRTEDAVEMQRKEADLLRHDVTELNAKLQTAERQVMEEKQRAEGASVELQEVRQQLDKKNSQVSALTLQLQNATVGDQLKEEVSLLRKRLAEEQEKSKGESRRLRELESEAECNKQELEEERQELKRKLQQQEVATKELGEREETLCKLVDELKQKLSEQEEIATLLRTQLEDAMKKSSEDKEELKRMNSDLRAEVDSLRVKVSNMAATEEETARKAAAEKDAATEKELQSKLREKEAQVMELQKSLREAQERRDEEESQAVQEARRREAERRRELLAVAHEAIAQKDEELEKRAEEMKRLKEAAQQDSDKVKSLGVDLQRKEDEASDLREKLADYKKQVQQVHKEISTMREEEKLLRQKLLDAEKSKKQLQSDVGTRDRTIQQLKLEQTSDAKNDQTLQLYHKTCKELEEKQRVMDDMRLALTEQEETQAQMEEVLEEKLSLVQELTSEVENLKKSLCQPGGSDECHHRDTDGPHDLDVVKREAAQAQESLKLCTEKHQAERRKWLEEKLTLIGHAKEAEDKRNQEMRKFADDRERFTRQQSQLELLSSQLVEKDQEMEKWRKERDTLVAALEVQLQKLLSSQAEKDKVIKQLQQNNNNEAPQPPESGGDGCGVAELQAALRERDADILRLKEELKASMSRRDDALAQNKSNESPVTLPGKPQSETISRTSGGCRETTRASVSSQGSAGYPSVLDSSEISTENGRTSRFPRPELEISFSPLQPNRMALRRQGDESAVTVKIHRTARKRKSGEMEKEEVEAENRRNTRSKVTPKLTPHQEETSSLARSHNSSSSIRSKKEGTLQKIGDFLQSSPTLFGSKAKKMMSLVSGRADADSAAASSSSSSSSSSLRAMKSKRKLYRPEISSPIDMPSHPIISMEPQEKESDHQIIKRRLRSRMIK